MTTLLDATTVKVDDVDLEVSGVEVAWSGSLFDALDPVFESLSVAGSDVSDTSDGTVQPKTWTVACKVTGSDLDDAWSKIRALRRRTKPGRSVTLTKSLPGGEGDTTVSLAASARRVGDTIAWVDGRPVATVATDYTLLSPWYATSTTSIASAATDGDGFSTPLTGSATVIGDIRTENMTITFTEPSTLENTTNGAWLTVSGAGSVDVQNFWESTVLTGFNRARPFRLEPGTNEFTLYPRSVAGAGSASIDYYPAYL